MVTSYQTFHFNGELTGEQIAFFEAYGFIHFKQFINQEAIASIVQASKEVEKRMDSERFTKGQWCTD